MLVVEGIEGEKKKTLKVDEIVKDIKAKQE
jgi:hypothetical protein